MEPRTETAIVKAYLAALHAQPSTRGRRTSEWLRAKAKALPAEIESAEDPLKRLALRQQLLDVEYDLETASHPGELQEAEKRFVKVARSYSERKGLSRAAWRAEGVPAAVLKRAGI